MKTTKHFIKIILTGVFIFCVSSFAQAGGQPTSLDCPDADDLMCCVVNNPDNPGADNTSTDYADSLDTWLKYFNYGRVSSRLCRERISFSDSVNEVHIRQPYTLYQDDNMDNFQFGNAVGDDVNFIVHDSVGEDAAIIVDGANGLKNVHFGKINIKTEDGDPFRGTLIKCQNGANHLVIDQVIVENLPTKPVIDIDGCTDVQVGGIQVNGSGASLEPIIYVHNGSSRFSFVNTDKSFEDIKGGVIKIEDSDDFTIDGLTVNYNEDAFTTTDTDRSASSDVVAIEIDNSYGTLNDIHINKINGTGIQFVNVSNGSSMIVGSIELIGGVSNDGNGIVIEDSDSITLSDISITNFGQNGVKIRGDSRYNTIIGSGHTLSNSVVITQIGTNVGSSAVYQDLTSGGNGVFIESTDNGEPSQNEISSSAIAYNLNCGVYLKSNSGNLVSNNDFIYDDECGVKGEGAVKELSTDDFVLIPRDEKTVLFDYKKSTFSGETIDSFELHVIKDGTSSDWGTSAYNRSRRMIHHRFRDRNVIETALANDFVASHKIKPFGVRRLVQIGSGSSTQSVYYRSSRAETTSYVNTYDYSTLPDANISENPSSMFFILALNNSGEVLGVWHGQATADIDCYPDPDTGISYSSYDSLRDSDSDGLPDYLEDINDNCIPDVGETSFRDEDTDDDGIKDGVEVYTTATDPLKQSSDEDALMDGEEDLNQDGVLDAGETDPNMTDTDGDGLSDSDELKYGTDPRNPNTDGDSLMDGADDCPLINENEGYCYYSHCPSDADEDADGDGIINGLEDFDSNCRRDATETDANLADTDGDGIPDGIEDYNQNGVYEPELDETNPVSTDTDGDMIPDGIEDANGNGIVDDATETDPRLSDTDGDGISDGAEDLNFDGKVDVGETNPALADTDGDGLLDSTPYMDFTDPEVIAIYDIAPWKYGPNNQYDVYYCGLNGFDSFDYDGEGLTDSEEDFDGDCQKDDNEPSPLLPDTDGDGVTDFQELMCGYGGPNGEGTDPTNPDSDGDGKSDYEEAQNTIEAGECGTLFEHLGDTWGDKTDVTGCSLNVNNDATRADKLPIILMMAVLAMMGFVRKMRGSFYGSSRFY